MVDIIHTDDAKSLAISLAGEIVLFVRDDLVTQKAIPLQNDTITLTAVLSRIVPILAQKIEKYLLSDTPTPLQVKEQALKTSMLLFKGQGGLVHSLVQQSKELTHLVSEKRQAIQNMHDEEMENWINERTKNGKRVLDETEKRIQSLHSKNILNASLSGLHITITPDQAQKIAKKSCLYLLREAQQYTLQDQLILRNNETTLGDMENKTIIGQDVVGQDLSDQGMVYFDNDLRQKIREETREEIRAGEIRACVKERIRSSLF